MVATVGSWWSAAASEEVKTAPSSLEQHKCESYLQPIGGARAQSRFAGRSATPIFTSPPLSGAPIVPRVAHPPPPQAVSAVETYANATSKVLNEGTDLKYAARGHTCDGSLPGGASSTATRWVFNKTTWRWELRVTEGSNQSQSLLQHMIAARRWGDSRDELAPAVQQATTATSPRLPAPKRHAVEDTSTGRELVSGGNITPTGFKAVGGMKKQKDALMTAVVYPLRHPKLYQCMGLSPCRGELSSIDTHLTTICWPVFQHSRNL